MTVDTDLRMMVLALEQAALAAEAGEVPVGAVVYRGHEVLARAHNLRETLADPCAHAELIAIREAANRMRSWRLVGCSVAVTLEPCPMCAGALINARVDRLVYGAADPKMGAVSTLYRLCTDARFNHRVEIVQGILADRCGRMLTEFFRRRRAPVRSDVKPHDSNSSSHNSRGSNEHRMRQPPQDEHASTRPSEKH